MDAPASQRVALVTGGAARLGRALAVALAEDGWDVIVSYLSSSSGAEEVHRTISGMGRRCEVVQADLTDPTACAMLPGRASEAFGHLDLLVNSAASFDSRPLLDVDAYAWDAVMNLNVRAPHLLVRGAAASLRRSRGSVVNVADLSAFQPWLEYPHHAVSKAALLHLTRVQARSLAPDVRVNAVVPGSVLPPNEWPQARVQALADAAPLRRIGTPRDVADAVIYLANASFVTGEVITIDGGRLLSAGTRGGGEGDARD